jgi:hypothetical protein
MADTLLSSHSLLDRLGREEQQMKRLGLHAQAAGVRAAIVILIKATQATNDHPPAIEPSDQE